MKKSILILLLGVLLLISGCTKEEEKPTTKTCEETRTCEESFPVITGESEVENIYFDNDWTNKFIHMLTATDLEDGDITNDIFVVHVEEFDFSTEGSYQITFGVFDSDGNYSEFIKTVIVEYSNYVYPTGYYDLSDAPSEVRNQFLRGAEDFLLDNMVGGIPLTVYNHEIYVTDRVQIPEGYPKQMSGYGIEYASLNTDDSHILNIDGVPGMENEYTLRSYGVNEFIPFELWETSSELTPSYYGYYTYYFNDIYSALYRIDANETNDGIELVSSMAKSDPLPIDGVVDQFGTIKSSTWQIELRDDLNWSFHPRTDLEFVSTTKSQIDANTYYDYYYFLIENKKTQQFYEIGEYDIEARDIVGYYDALYDKDFTNLGIKVMQNQDGKDLILQFEFNGKYTVNQVKGLFANKFGMIDNVEYYNYLSEKGIDYTSEPQYRAYSGPYYLDSYNDKFAVFKKNITHFDKHLYHYTSKVYQTVSSLDDLNELINDGYVDLIINNFDENFDVTELNTLSMQTNNTFKLIITDVGTLDKYQEISEYITHEPEPALANIDFKKAIYYSIDREALADNSNYLISPFNMHITSAYYQIGVSYRDSAESDKVEDNYNYSNYGYDFELAQEYFIEAMTELINQGHYSTGTVSNPTIIELELSTKNFDYFEIEIIEEMIEKALIDEERYIEVDVILVYDTRFSTPLSYDLSFDTHSESFFKDSYLQQMKYEEFFQYELNVGVDTSEATIQISYQDKDMEYRFEYWSYDAIVDALNGGVNIVEGKVTELPKATVSDLKPGSFIIDVEENLLGIYDEIYFEVLTYDIETRSFRVVEGYEMVMYEGNPILMDDAVPGISDPIQYYDDILPEQVGEYLIYTHYISTSDESIPEFVTYYQFMNVSTVDSQYTNPSMYTLDVTLIMNEGFDEEMIEIEVFDSNNNYTAFFDAEENRVYSEEVPNDTQVIIKITYESGLIDYIYAKSK